MSATRGTLAIWRRMAALPAGKWLFSRLVALKAPYFGSIRARFVVLERGRAVVRMRNRRRVRNHIGTVHAIAMCNLAELAAGTMTDATVPAGFRWIPKGMTVSYLAKAETDLTAVAVIEPLPEFADGIEVPVEVTVRDRQDKPVVTAVISMWVTARA